MSSHPYRSSAPPGVKALAVFVAIDAAYALVYGLGALGDGQMPIAIILGGFAVMQALVAVGLWTLEPAAWGVAAFVTAGVFVVEIAVWQPIGAALSGAVLAYLLFTREEFET